MRYFILFVFLFAHHSHDALSQITPGEEKDILLAYIPAFIEQIEIGSHACGYISKTYTYDFEDFDEMSFSGSGCMVEIKFTRILSETVKGVNVVDEDGHRIGYGVSFRGVEGMGESIRGNDTQYDPRFATLIFDCSRSQAEEIVAAIRAIGR